MLQARGRVLPISNDNPRIIATRLNGEEIIGEGEIYTQNYEKGELLSIRFAEPTYLADAARAALQNADAIIITPGTYYCTLLPVLMVAGLSDVLKEKQIPIVIVLNCLNRLGHTDGWTALDYVTGLEQAMGRPATHIMYNSAQPNTEQLSQYAIDSHPELLIVDNFEDDSRVIRAPLISSDVVHKSSTDVLATHRAFIRHDSAKVAEIIEKIVG
jgi:uncharacterized cofD-like protein